MFQGNGTNHLIEFFDTVDVDVAGGLELSGFGLDEFEHFLAQCADFVFGRVKFCDCFRDKHGLSGCVVIKVKKHYRSVGLLFPTVCLIG